MAVAMLPEDEAAFLVFLRAHSIVRIFRSSAPTAADLEVPSSQADFGVGSQFFVWNTTFPWRPELKSVPYSAPVLERRGWSYLSNTSTAPVLEYDRHGFDASQAQGRLYWAKWFASKDLAYDVDGFDGWYTSVVQWVRKNGRRVKGESLGPYYLPAALAQRGAA